MTQVCTFAFHYYFACNMLNKIIHHNNSTKMIYGVIRI